MQFCFAESPLVPGVADKEIRFAELFVKDFCELIALFRINFVSRFNEQHIVSGRCGLGVGIDAVTD